MQCILVTLYCFEPQPPQNFAVGFSFFPQLLQDEDVSFFFTGFCLTGFGVAAGFGLFVPPDHLLTAKTIPTIAATIVAAPIITFDMSN